MGLDIYFEKRKNKEIGYFRKVNFLVAFFEEKGMNVDCQHDIEVHKEDVEELLSKCEEVLRDHSRGPALLPTKSGFFFGSTNYDEYYYITVQQVRDFVKEELLPEFDNLKDDEYIIFSISY